MLRPSSDSRVQAWLFSRSGPQAGTRFPVAEGVTRIGRDSVNDVTIRGEDAAAVSPHHAEIWRQGESWFIRDLSTQGVWLNGARIATARVRPPGIIRLGSHGPEFALVWERDGTDVQPTPAAGSLEPHENLLRIAVARARRLRAQGMHGQTLTLMREVVDQALHHSRRRFRRIGYSLAAALVAVIALAVWKITVLNREKSAIDAHIHQLELQLENARNPDAVQLLTRLDDYQDEAQSLQKSLLYRLGSAEWEGAGQDDMVTRELREVMAEFGAESYSIPPEFLERVNHYIALDRGPNRPLIARALGQSAGEIRAIRRILEQQHLPPDLAYIPIVESALAPGTASAAGAAGPWQITAASARALGLRVDAGMDQRKDLTASTEAACRYLRQLILDFGAGSSVMLALAAYDSGAAKVKQAVNRTVQDPIKQRNFWYLYRIRALPDETREYVPKVFAAILIGRDPRRFGF